MTTILGFIIVLFLVLATSIAFYGLGKANGFEKGFSECSKIYDKYDVITKE